MTLSYVYAFPFPFVQHTVSIIYQIIFNSLLIKSPYANFHVSNFNSSWNMDVLKKMFSTILKSVFPKIISYFMLKRNIDIYCPNFTFLDTTVFKNIEDLFIFLSLLQNDFQYLNINTV